MKIVIKKRQHIGEFWQTIFEYNLNELLIGKEVFVDNSNYGKKEIKGFLGEIEATIDITHVKFGFKVLKKKWNSLVLEIFGEDLYKAKKDEVAPCKVKLRKNKEINFYRYENQNHVVYIITYVNDDAYFENIKQTNEELLNSKEFQDFAKMIDKKIEKNNLCYKSKRNIINR